MSVYTITTAQDNTGIAPPEFIWHACFGELDFGNPMGYGATESAAIDDLLKNNIVPWGGK